MLIEIQDKCGGLPEETVSELFRPFEQRSADRTGVGIGFAFSRWGAEANATTLVEALVPFASMIIATWRLWFQRKESCSSAFVRLRTPSRRKA